MRALSVVMVPGLGLGEEACAPTLTRLSCGARVVRLPGYGRAADRDADLAPATLAASLMRALADTPAPVVLVGHSASCQVVAEAAARFPAKVSAVVLIGPTTDPRSASWAGLAQRWLRTACWERPRQVPVLVREYTRTGLRSMLRGMDAARRHRIQEALAQCQVPILVLRGRHDRIAPGDWCRRLAGRS
jgi:pimeloyl-ACP methyl ester carboxylesterase